MKHIIIALALAGLVNTVVPARTVSSPNGRLVLKTEITNGKPVYSVTYDGNSMIKESPLGFKSNIGNYAEDIKHISDTVTDYSVDFEQDRIKHNRVSFKANRLISDYNNGKGQNFSIEWLVGDNDIAFRYLIPNDKGTRSIVVEREETGFCFPEQTTTFLTPQSDAMIGWKRTKPSYEEVYKADAPMSEKSQYGHGYTFPALFHVGDNGWVLLSETGVDGHYCGSRLSDYKDGVYTIEYPMPEENNGNGSASPGIAIPGATPWRTITVGDHLRPIAETVIMWAPLQPLYQADNLDTNGKGTWSWIVWQDNSINLKDQKKYVDLAADMGYEHFLIDCGWDKNIGRKGMKELAEYAASKGVRPAVWYSSSGWWNDIVQSPTDIMSRPIPRKQEMKWLHDLGVKTIKVDFFGGDKQETMRLYEDILSDAADYGLSVIFHGCTLPRGWERLYPNYVGSEAVLASENMVFSQDFCDNEAFNATLHPFIRNTVGCMEYGGTFFNKRLSRGNKKGTERKTSDAFQIAVAVLYQNPVQNFALSPEGFEIFPKVGIEFMKNVPTTWDETRLIDGYPGKYVVLARRHGDRWYIAGVSNLDKKTELTLNLPMFSKNQEVILYTDQDDNNLNSSTIKIKNPSKVKLTLRPNHGFVITNKLHHE